MNQYFDLTAVSSNGTELKDVKKEQGVKTKAIEMSRQITPIKDLVSLYKMIVFLQKEKPDIVHTHTPKAGLIGMLAALIVRVPHRLHTVAGLPLMESSGLKRKVLMFVERLTYKCATYVYPNSQGLKKFILDNNLVAEKKVKVLGNGSSNGIDTNHFKVTEEILKNADDIRRKYDIKKDQFIFIFVGRIVKDKGINELLSAFDNLTKKEKDIKLLLVGPFEETLDPLSDKSKEILKTNKHIIQAGFQDDVRTFFAVSDCLVFPSYREGFPNVVMQAGAMGLPSIVSDINGCNEIVEDGVNGLIVPPKDKDALYDAMSRVVQDDELKVSLPKVARKMIVDRYDQQFVWDAIKSEYDLLLGEKSV
jgi:glycosyltransferase involved in cell wall biosynthesis